MLGRNAYLASASASDLDGVEILLHHNHYHQPDAFSGLYLNAPPDAAAVFDGGEASAAAPAQKQAPKKDRHSKIHTAQGPRDRRVRLSIGIARKFFDLQEMLGFDKPSKTLDWLLTKSKAAIKELVQTRSAASSPSPSACEMISSDQIGGDSSSRKSGKSSAAKESRAKARARARERTLEKMCIKQLGGAEPNHPSSSSSSFDQCRNNQLEFLQLSAGPANPSYHLPLTTHQDLIEEPIVIKRKNKNNNPSLLGFHQNLVLNSNYTIPSAHTNANDNWDVFGQSNLHAAFDHHKFFNSSSNI